MAEFPLRSMVHDVLISVAAGPAQIPLLKSARELGLGLIGIDREPHAIGFSYCDAAVVASTHEPDEAIAALKACLLEHPHLRPVAVATKSSGAPVDTTAQIAREFGLLGLEPRRAQALVGKPGQLKFAALCGVRVPRHCAPPSLEEFKNTGLAPPLVLKPAATRVGKQGVALVTQAADLPRRFREAQAASADGRCEVEVFLKGQDLVVGALFRDSEVLSFVEIDEDTRFLSGGGVRGFGLSLPSRFRGTPQALAARASVTKFVSGLELGCGFGLWTFRIAPDAEPALLELHLDLAGDLLTDVLLPRALGRDPIALCLANLLGESVVLPEPERAVALRFLFEDDRPWLSRLGPDAWLSLGVEGGHPSMKGNDANGERIGHVLLERDTVDALAGAIEDLDRALGRPVA